MRRDPGRAVETTMPRENETTKLESSSVRVEHANEGQGAGRKEAMSNFGLCSVHYMSNSNSPGHDFCTRLDLVTTLIPLKMHRDRELKHVPFIVLHEPSSF